MSSVCNFQGDLSGEVESGQRYSTERRLQKRHGPADSGETERKPGKKGQNKENDPEFRRKCTEIFLS